MASLQGPMETSYGQAYVQMDKCLQDKTKGELSLETVRMFHADATAAGFRLAAS